MFGLLTRDLGDTVAPTSLKKIRISPDAASLTRLYDFNTAFPPTGAALTLLFNVTTPRRGRCEFFYTVGSHWTPGIFKS